MADALNSASGPVPNADEIECTRARTIAGIERCLAMLLAQLGRDYERCGKTACKRSRRCRGFACTPEPGDDASATPPRAAHRTHSPPA
jgi:hypothetical protein